MVTDYGKYGLNESKVTVNEDGSIDYDGDINLWNKNLTEIPFNFRYVSGYFYCYHNKLTSLEGAPQEVGKNFDCYHNNLTSLKGAPQKVGGYFSCSYNKLTTLKGAPQEVGGDFKCSGNNLTSLDGAPQKVGGYFYCSSNKLTSLEGAPKYVRGVVYSRNQTPTATDNKPEKINTMKSTNLPKDMSDILSNEFSDEDVATITELCSHSPDIVSEFRSIQNQQFTLFCKKQLSYGKGNIMLGGNIENEEDRIGSLRGIVIRLNDKLQRLINLVLKGNSNPLKDESIRDTFLDISVYAIIALIVDNKKWK